MKERIQTNFYWGLIPSFPTSRTSQMMQNGDVCWRPSVLWQEDTSTKNSACANGRKIIVWLERKRLKRPDPSYLVDIKKEDKSISMTSSGELCRLRRRNVGCLVQACI